jgi:hypothetical protein
MNTTTPPSKSSRLSFFLLSTIPAGILLASCAVPKPQPLSALGPRKIGPVSCQLDPGGATKPNYASTASGVLAGDGNTGGGAGGAIASLILKGAKELAEAPGQSKLENVSASVGSMERQVVLEQYRKQLIAAGYTIKDNSSYRISVVVSSYGVYKNLDGKAKILIQSGMVLRDSAGKIVWDGSMYVTNIAAKRQFQDYVNNPSQYGRDFEEAAMETAKASVNGIGTFSKEYDPAKVKSQP